MSRTVLIFTHFFKMRSFIQALGLVMIVTMPLILQVQTVQAQSPTKQQFVSQTGEIYLFRGLLNVFSRGIDDLASDLRRNGHYAIDENHSRWQAVADGIIKRKKQKKLFGPIVLVGHSLGANAVTKMANYLGQRGVRVSYVVSFDPTFQQAVGKNVRKVENYHIPRDNKNTLIKGRGFRGSLKNIDVKKKYGLTHLKVDKDKQLHKHIIRTVKGLTRRVKRQRVG